MLRFSPRPNEAHRVQWREWGEAAFTEARVKDRPIALFDTAFWCGVCQNMDETTLSNEEAIALLNAFFVPVRFEESQRPDVDLRYNQDGWPSIAFLTPEGDHLFTVNHMAPLPFTNLLVRVVSQFQEQRDAILAAAAEARSVAAAKREAPAEAPRPLDAGIVAEVAGLVEGLADGEHGGFGSRIKLLHPEANELFLYLYETTGERTYLDHVLLTLAKMKASRLFDERDGGFYRYSSRVDWNEPHPEKLLDDHAALIRNHLRAYLLTDDDALRETAGGLVDYVFGTLSMDERGPFYGCQDYVRPQRGAPTADGPPERISYIDEYVYCDANAHMASALLDAWWLLGREDCRARARAVLDWLWTQMRSPDGGMYHYWDGRPHVPGLLMDAARTGLAFLDAYALLGDECDLARAKTLADDILRLHRNPRGGFYDLSERGPGRLEYPMTLLTQNATVATLFLRLADLGGDPSYRDSAQHALAPFTSSYAAYEAFAAGYGQAVGRFLAPPVRVTLRGRPGDPALRALTRSALTGLRAGNVLLCFEEGSEATSAEIEAGGRSTGPLASPDAINAATLAQLLS
jgi:uncharacterized protein YyaL (SSP411 family)